MKIEKEVIVLSSFKYGESDVIAKFISVDGEIISALIKRSMTAKGRTNVVSCGNFLKLSHYKKEGVLGSASVVPIKNYGFIAMESIEKISQINLLCNLTELLLDGSQQPTEDQEAIFALLHKTISSIAENENLKHNLCKIILIAKKILSLAGYGFDLGCCVATKSTNKQDLTFISPKSLAAVSSKAAEPYRNLMLPLPEFFLLDREKEQDGQLLEYGIKIIATALNKIKHHHKKVSLIVDLLYFCLKKHRAKNKNAT